MRRMPENAPAAVRRPEDCAFWAGGTGTQDPDGRLHMKTVLAIGHQPDRTFYRALQAHELHRQVYSRDGTDRICLMPVRDEHAQTITERLRRRAAKASPLLARAARIGLGQDATTETAPVPLYCQTIPQNDDGTLTKPLTEDAYAEPDREGRLHGRIDAGKEKPGMPDPADKRPGAWAAGFAFADALLEAQPDLPTMPEILAVADHAITAMRRAAWIARHDDGLRERYFDHDGAKRMMTLRAIPISRSDAETLNGLIRSGNFAGSDVARTALGENPEADGADIDELLGRKTTMGGTATDPGPPPPGTNFAPISIRPNGTIYIE